MPTTVELKNLPSLPGADITASALELAQRLGSTTSGDGFVIPFRNLKLILLYNPTAVDANVTIKAQTPVDSDIRLYLNTVLDDYRIVLEPGKIGFIKPNYLLVNDEDNILIDADQLIDVIPLSEWSVNI